MQYSKFPKSRIISTTTCSSKHDDCRIKKQNFINKKMMARDEGPKIGIRGRS